MANTILTPSLALLLGALAPAQSRIVLPASHATVEGTGSTNVPLGRSTPMRVQMAYDAALFPGVRTLQGMALRVDGGQTAAGKRVELELRTNTLVYGITGIQAAFDQNRGTDQTVVVDRRMFDLPPLAQALTPNPFHVSIPFDRTFRFDPARGALLIDWFVHGQAPGAFSLDTTYLCDSPQQALGPAGCGPVGGRALRADCLTSQVLWGRSFALRVSEAQPGAATFLFLGTNQGTWGGLPLPIDLGPIGAPGCSVSIDLLVAFGAAADGSGTFTQTLFVPSMTWLQSQWLHFQGVALDPRANVLGLVSSQAAKVQVCGWEPVSRVWASTTTATMGAREMGIAAVLELTMQ